MIEKHDADTDDGDDVGIDTPLRDSPWILL